MLSFLVAILIAFFGQSVQQNPQYDAWNRLVQVNEAYWDGALYLFAPGEFLKHHDYDGFGRLVRTQSPFPDPQTAGTDRRTEHFYYDGARRIQEIVVDPMASLAGALGSGSSTTQQAGTTSAGQQDPAVDPNATTVGLESNLVGEIGLSRQIAREYIWGPGDNGVGGFDELIVQYNTLGEANWAIHDLGGDLVALCELDAVTGAAVVVGQWTYDAYGQVLSAEHLGALIHPHLGHKGLFLDRMDSGITSTSGETPRLVPFVDSTYQNRNRVYNPRLGRFMQQDPNATGLPLLDTQSLHGLGFDSVVQRFDLEELYTDGSNIFQYLSSNPSNRRDPLGLSGLDLFADVGIPGPTDMITGMLESLVTEYADRLGWDVDWAADWEVEDDWHSRLDSDWVLAAMGRGINGSFRVGIGDFSFNPLDAFAAGVLPAGIIVKQNGVTIEHYYRSGDHGGPVHVHVKSDGKGKTRVGPRGRPLDNRDRELTVKERAVYKANRFKINRSIKKIQRWIRKQPWPGSFPRRPRL